MHPFVVLFLLEDFLGSSLTLALTFEPFGQVAADFETEFLQYGLFSVYLELCLTVELLYGPPCQRLGLHIPRTCFRSPFPHDFAHGVESAERFNRVE